MPKITVDNLGCTIEANPGLSLLNNFILQQAPIHTVCGGRARCGCCRVRILVGQAGLSRVNAAERAKLGDELVAQGWRLSCQTHALRDATVYMPGDGELVALCEENRR